VATRGRLAEVLGWAIFPFLSSPRQPQYCFHTSSLSVTALRGRFWVTLAIALVLLSLVSLPRVADEEVLVKDDARLSGRMLSDHDRLWCMWKGDGAGNGSVIATRDVGELELEVCPVFRSGQAKPRDGYGPSSTSAGTLIGAASLLAELTDSALSNRLAPSNGAMTSGAKCLSR